MDDRAPAVGPAAIEATSDVLTVHRPVDDLPEPHRTALSIWLVEHYVDPVRVKPHTAIERDTASGSITWRESTECGVAVHRRFPPIAKDGTWPAEFPEVLFRSAELSA